MNRTLYQIAVLLLSVLFVAPTVLSKPLKDEIPEGLVWINSERPVKISDLKGKFVLVYFWSYGSRDIQSIVDQCRELQEKYPDELVVISVHTGKALNDDDLNRRVVDAVGAYRISYPVAIDNQLAALNAFHLDVWPSVVLFGPDGSVLFRKTGERDLFHFMSKLIEKNRSRFETLLDRKNVQFQPSPDDVEIVPAQVNTPQPAKEVNAVPDGLLNAQTNPVVNEAVETTVKTDPIEGGSIFVFDLKKFTGENIPVNREYSQNVGTIDLKFRLPDGAKILGEDKSYVRVFSANQKLLAYGIMAEPRVSIPLNKEILDSPLHIEAMLYYCTTTDRSLCRIKGMLFTVPLAPYKKQENILIEHDIAS